MHISEKGQTALTLADGLGDIGIRSVCQRDTLTTSIMLYPDSEPIQNVYLMLNKLFVK